MSQHNYYPVALNVQNKECLVIGHDKESSEKSARLKEAGAKVTVVDAAQFSIDMIGRQFLVVFCPKDQPALTKQVWQRCQDKRVLLCAIDQPAYCDVVNVSIFDKGRLRMTIGTGGAAPAISRKIRQGLEKSLADVPVEAFLDDLAALRKQLEKEVTEASKRIPQLLEAAEGFEFEAQVRFPKDWRKPVKQGGGQ